MKSAKIVSGNVTIFNKLTTSPYKKSLFSVEKDRLCDTLELNLCKGDGTEENWSYHLNAAEQEVLARKMEAFYQQQTGTSLHEYARQLRESGSQTPEMQM